MGRELLGWAIMPRQFTAFRIQDLVRDEQQFHELQAMMRAEGWTSAITRMSWAEFQGIPSVGECIAAEIEAKTAPKN